MTPTELMQLRLSLGFTQKELAAILGVHPMTVNKWENAHHRIPEMVRLAMVGLRVERRSTSSAARTGAGE